MNDLITLARKDAADRDCPYFVRDTLVLCADAIEAKDAEIERLTNAVDDREASLVRMRDMLNQSRAEIARLQADGIHSCHADCTRSGCVNARLRAENEALRASIATAYGYLWHVNNEPGTPAAIYPPERAAYKARMVLRVLLADEQRGKGINEARAAIDAARGTT